MASSYTAQFKAANKPVAKPAPKAKLKATVVNNIEDVTPKPTLSESIHDDIKGLFEKYKVVVPSTTRVILSFVACAFIGMGIGYIGSIIVETLTIAALLTTNSLFIAVAIYVLGVVAVLYSGYTLGTVVGNYIMSGDVDRSYQKYSNAVRSFFSFGNREVTA